MADDSEQLEYLVADAKAKGCKTLVSVGGVQSNHIRAVTAVTVASGLKGGFSTSHPNYVDRGEAVTVQEKVRSWFP